MEKQWKIEFKKESIKFPALSISINEMRLLLGLTYQYQYPVFLLPQILKVKMYSQQCLFSFSFLCFLEEPWQNLPNLSIMIVILVQA